MKILIVDDNEEIRRMLGRRLKRARYEICSAANGQEAIEMIGEVMPDLTLMDMHMPVMDGYAAVRALRSRGYAGTIAALTASVMSSDIPKAIEAGCDYFLAKPIGTDFEKKIEEILKENIGRANHADAG